MALIKNVHILIILTIVVSVTLCKKRRENKKNQLDLPMKGDLKYFIVSLQKVIEYCESIRSKGLISVGYGLYFVVVNLKTVLRYRHNFLAKSLQHQLQDLIENAQRELSYIVEKFKKHSDPDDVWNKFNLMVLGENPMVWVERLGSVDARPPPPLVTRRYHPVVYNLSESVMSGAACGKSLINKIKYEMEEPICHPNKHCYNFLINNQQHCTQLSQRLLVLVIARFARGCSMFSDAEDKELLARNCAIAYEEIDKIFSRAETVFIGFAIEQLALCLLAGHREFHRRALYNKVLKYQQWQGCFGLVKPKRKDLFQSADMLLRRWALTFAEGHLEYECNTDISSVAAASLSAGIRFMLNGEVD